MGFGTLGFGLPAAIGAKLAVPERPVVVLAGDGGFLFTCQELATAVQFGVAVVIIVFNDNGYGILRPQQQGRYGRTNAADLVNPDFVALARAFGASGQRVEAIGELGAAIQSRTGCGQPIVDRGSLVAALPPHGRGHEKVHGSAGGDRRRLSFSLGFRAGCKGFRDTEGGS